MAKSAWLVIFPAVKRLLSCRFSILLASATIVALPSGAGGQAPRSRKEATAIRIERGVAPPRVDGRLDEEVWARAPFVSDFVAKQPVEGAPPTVNTRVAFVYDEDALYIGARMDGRRPGDVPVLITRRDNFESTSEVLVVALDTYLDRRTAYTFAVTSAGTRVDFFQPTDVETSRDFGYDPVWEARTTVDSTGWTAEMRIPFSQLRFAQRDRQTWGLNIDRWAPARDEDMFWVMVPRNESGWSSRFGTLNGISGIRPARRLEVVPYGAARSTITGNRNLANPFDDGRNVGTRAGADLKMGLGPSVTLDATVTPDFGQVEADPAEVNLSAFPTFFTERRPFFNEGSDLLQMAGFFYSRRIGAPPHGSATSSFVDAPSSSPILGAMKLSGRPAKGWSLAALSGITGRGSAHTYDTLARAFDRVPVEPVTGYGVARLVREFGSTGSTAGLMLTGVRRDVGAGDPMSSIVTRDAVTGGTNGTVRWGRGKYQALWMAGFSYVRGDTAALQLVQQSSAHFFQRPDMTEARYDPHRTSLAGYTFSWRLEKLGGRHWLWDTWGEFESPTFEINDLGRLMSGDDRDFYVDLKYRENQPGPTFYNYQVGLSAKSGWNFGGDRQFSQISLTPNVTWKNYWNTWLRGAVNARAFKDDQTRGGPVMELPLSWEYGIATGTNGRRPTSLYGEFNLKGDELGGWSVAPLLTFSARPGGRWSLSVSPRYVHSVEPRQYVTTLDGGDPVTFGHRYIFSFIERSTVASQFRLNYALKPDLTLELYAEPFAASGRYYGFGELAAPRSRDLRVYGAASRAADSVRVIDGSNAFAFANPDFNVLSFRSNVVLRWEWRPGSALYIVWQQNRSRTDAQGDPVGPGRLWDSFITRGDNFLAFKMTYWFPVL